MKKSIIALAAFAMFAIAAPAVSSASTVSSTVTAQASDKNDTLLDQYEKLMKEYVQLVKNSKGNATDLAKLTQLQTKLADLYDKLSDADLTDAQLLRLSQIASKIAASMK